MQTVSDDHPRKTRKTRSKKDHAGAKHEQDNRSTRCHYLRRSDGHVRGR
ncbi:DUF3223 domain-containing protein [Paraburkholderia sp. BL18I3N2]